jgi:hypothetical protein
MRIAFLTWRIAVLRMRSVFLRMTTPRPHAEDVLPHDEERAPHDAGLRAHAQGPSESSSKVPLECLQSSSAPRLLGGTTSSEARPGRPASERR